MMVCMHKPLICLVLVGTLFLIPFADLQGVCGDPATGIVYSSGVHLYSPLNTTYTTNTLTLNLTYLIGIQSRLNFTLDGIYDGEIPLRVANASDVHIIMTEMAGTAALPRLEDGSHCLTINVEADLNDYYGANPPGAPFYPTNSERTNWQAAWTHTIYFTVDTNAAAHMSNPSTATPTPPPQTTVVANSTPIILPPAAEPQQTPPTTVILLVIVVAAYIAVFVVLIANNPKRV